MPKIYHQRIRAHRRGYLANSHYYTRGSSKQARFIRPLLSVKHIYTLIWPNNFPSLTGYWLETISMKLACSYAAKLREKTTRICSTTWRRGSPKHPRIGWSRRCRAQQTFGYLTLSQADWHGDPFTVKPIDAALIRARDYTSRYSTTSSKRTMTAQ